MPKRYSNIFEAAITMDSLYAAYLSARKGKRNTKAVENFERNLGHEITKLHEELKSGQYKPRAYRSFWVFEPKPRLIAAPAFRDVIVQHAFYKLIYPIFDKSFIYHSYGCRIAKGNHKATNKTQEFLRKSKNGYYLQLDIKKFYYTIDKEILINLLERKLKEKKTVELLTMFVYDDQKLGVPIGNLLSQLFALIYLNPLDHFIKRELKVKHYVRYVDDFILFGLTKSQAFIIKEKIEQFLNIQLKLELSKFIIQKNERGINFVGFRTWEHTRLVRKRSLYNFSKSLKLRKEKSLISIVGNAKYSGSYKHFKKKLQEKAKWLKYTNTNQYWKREIFTQLSTQ